VPDPADRLRSAPRDDPCAPGDIEHAAASGRIGSVHDLADSATGPDLRDDPVQPRRSTRPDHVDDPGERPVPPRLAEAVDLARAAAVDAAEGETDQVGEALAVHAEDAADDAPVTAATHYLAAHKPGYDGWTWAVTVMVAGDDPDAPVTLGEVALLPGAGAVVAPEWIPWNERVRAEDLSPGDLLPVDLDDDRLVPAYVSLDDDFDPVEDADEDEQVRAVADELGFGRPRVMSPEGRFDAAARWSDGDFGPAAEMARAASAHCGTCGFYLSMAGSLRGAFGVCGNGNVPADGHVVHAEYGCGGHSELQIDTGSVVMVAELVYDDGVDMESAPEPVAAASGPDGD
jgi:hypothetical protein